MLRASLVSLWLLAFAAAGQEKPRPLPEEVTFSKLTPDLQRLLGHLSPADALYRVEVARQNLIALGQPNPSPQQLYVVVERVLQGNAVVSASAGATSFPPLSPLAAPPPPPLAR